MKPKKCKGCGSLFQPVRPLQVACGPMCGLQVGRAKQEKAKERAKKEERKADVAKLAKLSPLRKLLKDAQTAFNRWIRSRDEKQPCISCGAPPPPPTYHGGRDAGHFRSTGAASHLRFHEDNCHAQCVRCNQYLSGNVSAYRARLVERIGLDRVEALERMNDSHKWQREEVIAIKEEYAKKLKALKNSSQSC